MSPMSLSRRVLGGLGPILALLASTSLADPPASRPASTPLLNNDTRRQLPVVGIPSEGRVIGGARSLVTTRPSTLPARATTRNDRRLIAFELPIVGIPHGGRIIGGSRTAHDSLTLGAISPDDLGLTRQAAPCLFWYISRPTDRRIEFALNRPDQIEPVLFANNLNVPATAGISRIDLAAYGKKLEPGIVYEWVIAVVQDEARRSHDIVATGLIQLEDAASPIGGSQLASQSTRGPRDRTIDATQTPANPLDRAALFARQGLWYDAFQAVSDAIDRDPSDAWAREQRAALLAQIGLGKIDASISPRKTQ